MRSAQARGAPPHRGRVQFLRLSIGVEGRSIQPVDPDWLCHLVREVRDELLFRWTV
jgi:hypothetical protein